MAYSENLKTKVSEQLVFPNQSETAPLFKSFTPIKDGNNNYFILNEDKDDDKVFKVTDEKSYPKAYSLIYFPLIDGLTKVNLSEKKGLQVVEGSTLKIETTIKGTKPKEGQLIPLLINFDREVEHWCDDGKEDAGDKTCSDLLKKNSLIIFKKDFGTGHIPITYTLSKWKEEDYKGIFYFIPTILPNLSVCYLITNDIEAVKLFKAQITENMVIAIDYNIHPVDEWNCFVTFFNAGRDGKTLTGSRIIEKTIKNP